MDTCQSVAFQEGIEWHPIQPTVFSPWQKTALTLNLPALILAIPIAVAFHRGSDSYVLLMATPFVPLLWFFVGRWLDIQLGYIENARTISTVGGKVLRLTAIGTCVVLLLPCLASLATFNHRDADSVWVGSASVIWLALMIVIAIYPSGIRYSHDYCR